MQRRNVRTSSVEFWHSLARFVAEAYPQSSSADTNLIEQYIRNIEEYLRIIVVFLNRSLEIIGSDNDRSQETSDYSSESFSAF